jgi:hypothetical protein
MSDRQFVVCLWSVPARDPVRTQILGLITPFETAFRKTPLGKGSGSLSDRRDQDHRDFEWIRDPGRPTSGRLDDVDLIPRPSDATPPDLLVEDQSPLYEPVYRRHGGGRSAAHRAEVVGGRDHAEKIRHEPRCWLAHVGHNERLVMTRRHNRWLIGLVCALVLVLVSCSDSSDDALEQELNEVTAERDALQAEAD